jgi:hypothetical protein
VVGVCPLVPKRQRQRPRRQRRQRRQRQRRQRQQRQQRQRRLRRVTPPDTTECLRSSSRHNTSFGVRGVAGLRSSDDRGEADLPPGPGSGAWGGDDGGMASSTNTSRARAHTARPKG